MFTEDRMTPRYLGFQPIGRSYSLVIDTLGQRDPHEVRGANHAAEADRIAAAWNAMEEVEEPSFVDFGEPVG
jgi:hypothetical protein